MEEGGSETDEFGVEGLGFLIEEVFWASRLLKNFRAHSVVLASSVDMGEFRKNFWVGFDDDYEMNSSLFDRFKELFDPLKFKPELL